jgi:plastocyanin
MRIHRVLTAPLVITALVAGFTVGSSASPAAVLPGANGRIVFVSDRDGNKEIYTSRADGTGVVRLTTNTTQDYDPAFSSDGSKIAFVSDRTSITELYTMNADGANVKKITSNSLIESHPSWDPLNKQITFSALNGSDSDIYKIQSNGASQVDLTPDPVAFDANPSWSPGGMPIAFDRTLNNATNVYTMLNDGTSILQLTTTGADSNPAYAPDNKTLAFESARDNLPPAPSVFASVQKPIGIAFTATQLLVTEWNKDKVLSIDSSGLTTTFATLPPTGNASLERYIAVSPGLGCFAAGDIYVTVRDQVLKITPDGQTVTVFATIPALPNSNNFLVFDKVGTFDNNLIVVGGQKSKVFVVDCTGAANLVIDMSGVTSELEGSDVAPLSWGPYGGDLIAASKFNDTVYAITPGPNSTYSVVGTWPTVEQAIAVPSKVCDFGQSGGAMFVAMESNNGGQIWKFPGSMLTGLSNQFLTPSEITTDIGQFVSNGSTITISDFWNLMLAPDLEETAFAPCGGHNSPATTRPAPAGPSARSAAGGYASRSLCALCPHEIYKMQAKDGSGLIRLTNSTTDDAAPAWSADGTMITFQTDRNDPNPSSCESTQTCKNEVYTMSSVDGSGQTNISNSAANDYTPNWEGLSFPPVVVTDFVFTPSTDKPTLGGSILWDFKGASAHTATDSSFTTPPLFDSGSKSAGTYYVFPFIGAGQYPYYCTIHPSMTGTVKVPMKAAPKTGNLSTVFTITWASIAPSPGFVFDVQIQRPGGSFVDWMAGTRLTNSTFVADQGAGTYSFQARLRKPGTPDQQSNYSVPVFITVTL